MKPVVVVENLTPETFKETYKDLVEKGYQIYAVSCDDDGRQGPLYQAIFTSPNVILMEREEWI